MNKIQNLLNQDNLQSLLLMGIRMISLVSKFILSVYIARYMGFEIVGIYGLIISLTFIIPALTGFGIMYVKTRNAVLQTPEDIIESLYYYGRLIAVIYAILASIAIPLGYLNGELLLVIFILLVIFFEHVNNDFFNLQLNLSRPFIANILHSIRTSIWICVFIAFSYIFPSQLTLPTLLLYWIIGGGVAFLGFFWSLRNWELKKAKPLIPFLIWLKNEFKDSKRNYINEIANTGSNYLNYFLTLAILGIELMGVYVFFIQIISALTNLIQTGILQISRPKLIKSHESKYRLIYIKCMQNALVLSILMAIISLPVLFYLIEHIIEKPLALDWYPVFILMLLPFIINIARAVNNLVFYSQHRDDIILRQSIIGIVIELILGSIFISIMGLWGAPVSAIATGLIILIIQINLLRGLVKK